MKLVLCASVVTAVTLVGIAAQVPNLPALSAEGRFLYAHDDDWDWATPIGANEISQLGVAYGKMPWSALDWMEEGLPEVRGMLVGTPPALGNYLTMADLNKLRGAGPKLSYEQIPHKNNTLANLFRDKKPPNVVIIMQDLGTPVGPPVSAEDAAAALEFVARGGRLMVLDDWQYYRALVSPFLDAKKFPPLKAPPAPGLDQKLVLEKIHLLDSPAFPVREKATADLLKMGSKIVSVLEEFKPATVEQEMRIKNLLQQLKPLPPPVVGAGDPWMLQTAQQVFQLHKLCELKVISRNGNKELGHALCLRLPVPK